MPSHATRIHPRNATLRRSAPGRATPAAFAHAYAPAAASTRKRRERADEAVQPRAKLWHIALGIIALLCSGIELG